MHAHAHPPRRLPALLAALAVGAASAAAAAQGLTAGGTGGAGGSVSGGPARGGPALAAPAQGGPSQPAAATPSAATPLPGQSALPSQLPPLNANGLNGAPATGVGPNGGAPMAGALPTRGATAAQAFGMLDRGQVGYVTRADTDRIPGFVGFDNADSNRDGQLSPEEFNAAWRFYSGQ